MITCCGTRGSDERPTGRLEPLLPWGVKQADATAVAPEKRNSEWHPEKPREQAEVKIKARAHYKAGHLLQPQGIEKPEDVDRVIDFLLSAKEEYHSAAKFLSLNRDILPSGFPDHEFIVGINPTHGKGAIIFGYEEFNFATLGDTESAEEILYHVAGYEAYFPEKCELPVDHIREAVKEFVFSGGELPTCVTWQPVA
ncbi:Imm1 family immunity protein [Streptomyces filamentosus]